MEITSLYLVLLSTSLTFLIAQLFVRKKRIAHIIFAVFCGSIAIMATQKLTGESLGAYQYLLAMGTCATCNGYWLLSRSLFRDKNPLQFHHLLFAIAIALLVVVKQGYLFASSTFLFTPSGDSITGHILSEMTLLLSSCVLVLSFWEGCRGFKEATKQDKAQRLLFLATFGLAVTLSKVSQGLFAENPQAMEWTIVLITLFVLVNTHILMWWRFKNSDSVSYTKLETETPANTPSSLKQSELSPQVEQALAKRVKELIIDQSRFLQANLKVADIARELDVPEYRISKALRGSMRARNFNQYINELRIGYAQNLLTDPEKQKWSVFIIGLESGFASVGPFTRAFKSMTNFTPNQYRQYKLSEG